MDAAGHRKPAMPGMMSPYCLPYCNPYWVPEQLRRQHLQVAFSQFPHLTSQQLNGCMNKAPQLQLQQQPVLPRFQRADIPSEATYLDYCRHLLLSDDDDVADLDCSNTPCLLLKKKLTSTDTNVSQSRLSVPKSAVKENFTAPLFWQLEIDRFNTKEGFDVTTFDENGEKYGLRLKFWKSCGTYVLTGSWREFLLNNNLQGTEKEISLWAYRHPHTRGIVFLIIPAH